MRAFWYIIGILCLPHIVNAQETASETAAAVSGPQVEIGGFVRARFGSIFQNDNGPDFVGQNDGFMVENARLVADIRQGIMRAFISIDGAIDRRAAANTAEGQVDVGLRDAWVGYETERGFGLMIGQFKPAYDAEELQSTADMLFIDRAVESRGIRGVEGFNMNGLSLTRQVGIQSYGQYPIAGEWRVAYSLSVTNGSNANRPQNDNDSLAYVGRLSIHQGEYLTLGGGAYMNRLTTGVAPDLLAEDQVGWVVDLHYRRPMGGFTVLLSGQFMETSTEAVDVPNEPELTARGYHGAAGFELPMGLAAAYRYAFMDPTADFEAEDPAVRAVLDIDAVTLHTLSLGYQFKSFPVKAQANYTFAAEQSGREVDNDRLDLLVQAMF